MQGTGEPENGLETGANNSSIRQCSDNETFGLKPFYIGRSNAVFMGPQSQNHELVCEHLSVSSVWCIRFPSFFVPPSPPFLSPPSSFFHHQYGGGKKTGLQLRSLFKCKKYPLCHVRTTVVFFFFF